MTGVRMTGWCRWVALLALVVLSACGGGKKNSVPTPTANATATPIGAVGDGKLSTFSITGSNLRTAQLVIDGCDNDLLIKGRTNQEIVFECTPNKIFISIDVLDSTTGDPVATVEAIARSVNDPVVTSATVSTGGNAQVGVNSNYTITGSNLDTATLEQAFGCAEASFNITLQTATQIQFDCEPSDPEVRLNLYNRLDMFSEVVLVAAAEPPDPVLSSTVAASVGAAVVGKKSTYTVTGTNFRFATIGLNTGCAAGTGRLISKTDTSFQFSCTATQTSLTFTLRNRVGAIVADITASALTDFPPGTVTLTNVVSASINDPSYAPARLGQRSTFDLIGNNLYSDLHTITAEGCNGLSYLTGLDGAILGVECIPISPSVVFTVRSSTSQSVLTTYTANFTSLPRLPLSMTSVQSTTNTNARVSVIGQPSAFRVVGYFDEATALTVSSDGCTNIANQSYDQATSVFTFTCTPQRFDTSFRISNQNNAQLAELSFPIRVTFSITVNGNTEDAKFLIVALDYKNAPITVANFLSYVEKGTEPSYYANTLFHRSVTVAAGGFSILQGGAFINAADVATETRPGTIKPGAGNPIPMESTATTGLSNTRGTIAMARTSDPNSATSQFFFNVSDNTFLDAAGSNPGYAVFGQVVTEGSLDTLDLLNNISVDADDIPTQDIRIVNVVRTM